MNSSPQPSIDTNKTAPKAFSLGGLATGKGANWKGLMFAVQLKTGNVMAYPYAYVQKITFDKSGSIEIELVTEKLVIAGRHLADLYQGLVDHQVREIVEADVKYQAPPEGEAFIRQIDVVKS